MNILNIISSAAIPVIIVFAGVYGAVKKCDVFDSVRVGAADGLKTIGVILPSLIGLLCAVYMLRASGAIDVISFAAEPVLKLVGIPKELTSLLIIRPLSGSGALAAGTEIMQEQGVDSLAGKMTAAILASSETTFYTAAIYFGAAGVTKTRYAIPAALAAELAAFLSAAYLTTLLLK